LWISTQQAADALGVTERTIRRMCEERKIGSRVQRLKGRKPFRVVNAADLERLVAEQSRPAPALVSEGRVHDVVEARVPTIVRSRELPAASAPILVPHLTLSEAVELSKLPAAYLVAAARAGTIRAVNVGTSKREFWRFPMR